jgi:hypothetical protein
MVLSSAAYCTIVVLTGRNAIECVGYLVVCVLLSFWDRNVTRCQAASGNVIHHMPGTYSTCTHSLSLGNDGVFPYTYQVQQTWRSLDKPIFRCNDMAMMDSTGLMSTLA